MILLLNELTNDELSNFENFLYSPYFTRNRSLILLFKYLKPFYPKVNDNHISYKEISEKVLKEKSINKVKIRKMFSDFTKVLDTFFLQTEIENDTEHNKFLMLNALRKRSISRRFENELRTVLTSRKKVFSKDDDFYLADINIYDTIFYYNFSNLKLKFADILQKKSDSIDYMFVFMKLHVINEMLNNESGRKQKFNKRLMDEVIAFVRDNKKEISSAHPNIYVIYLVVMMNITDDDLYVDELTRFLRLNEKKFDRKALSYFYHYIRAFYVHKINHGKIIYRNNLFETIKIMRKKKLFLIDNIITDMEFNSVVNAAIPLKQYKWITGFINEYKNYIHQDFACDAYNLAISKVLYAQKEYGKVFDHLNKVEFKEPYYYYSANFVLSRMFFDTKNFIGVKSIIDNLKQYIRTNKLILNDQVDVVKVFIKYMNALLRIAEVNSSKNVSMKVILKKEIENEKILVTNIGWFFEKIEEL